ncbi:MAG: AAA domain-containing protein [Cyclobacteriaceae bacterium]
MNAIDELKNVLELIRLERQADLDQYRMKVLQTPLHRKTKEGICWYPVRIRKNYIGTGERLIIEVERVTETDQPHVFQSGKMVSVFSNAEHKPERDHMNGVINYVRDTTMVITLNVDDLPEWFDNGKIGIDVMFDEMTYREMEIAMKAIIKAEDNRAAELREILLGHRKALVGSVPASGDITTLNESQQSALANALAAEDVGIIHGPPGTGKTTTLVKAILRAIEKEGQVLVSAPSNAAVDLLTEKLSDEHVQVVRIGHPARVTDQSLSKTMDARIANHANYKELKSLRRRMEELRSMASKYKRNFGYHEKEQRRLLRQEANMLKADADTLEFYIINDILQKSQVITCTLVGASHHMLRGRKYHTVFIDEAAQALEPACWIPILRAHRVIFAGDHCQLPPTIKSREAAQRGLAQTLFEKCIERQPLSASMLAVQYRMHEHIMRFSSHYFYHDQLIADDSVKTHALPGSAPVEFVDTAGCGFAEKQDPETLSRFNQDEAELVIRLAERLVEELGINYWLQEGFTMGIIAPYSAQVEKLHGLADAATHLHEIASLISINTVDSFQGQERDVILISFVRSNEKNEIGFLSDIRRTNVAMTRARKKLIMVGDTATLASHPFYAELVEFVQSNNFYKSAYEIT